MSDASKKALASEQEARDVAESAREQEWEKRSFCKQLFNGRFALDLIEDVPEMEDEEQKRSRAWLEELEHYAAVHIDGDRIDREGFVPQELLDDLADLGAFGIKIPEEYGGLGFGQVTYGRALSIVSSRCGATGAFLSAHQSIGVPAPLLYFGTDDQKTRYLPRLAAGSLSAFALTEEDAGSDPANMSTTANLANDGDHWILNGEKIWCTNGPRAEMIIVMARTPDHSGKGRKPISAFIVETAWEGVEVVLECDFMGLKGLSNGVLRFRDVRVPKENLLWDEGKGLKLALITLNTGRLSLPAFCAAAGKASLEMSRRWGAERVQWGRPVGKHDAIAQMLGRMASHTFAMDSLVEITSAMADSHTLDLRLEAAVAKMWNSEIAWELANDALQIRGGRGYETHDSLRARGEASYPIERLVRDLRINLIFEGSSEIMRLFIAREAVDDHLKVAGDMIDPRAPLGRRLRAAVRAGIHYAWWFPTRFFGWGFWPRHGEYGRLARHLRFVDRSSRRLARAIFYAMARFGPGLEKRQAVLGRVVDIGAELFVMVATCVRAKRMKGEAGNSAVELADVFCRHSRRRVGDHFRRLFDRNDVPSYKLAREALEGRFEWLEKSSTIPLEEIYAPSLESQLTEELLASEAASPADPVEEHAVAPVAE